MLKRPRSNDQLKCHFLPKGPHFLHKCRSPRAGWAPRLVSPPSLAAPCLGWSLTEATNGQLSLAKLGLYPNSNEPKVMGRKHAAIIYITDVLLHATGLCPEEPEVNNTLGVLAEQHSSLPTGGTGPWDQLGSLRDAAATALLHQRARSTVPTRTEPQKTSSEQSAESMGHTYQCIRPRRDTEHSASALLFLPLFGVFSKEWFIWQFEFLLPKK